jgi:DNA mismatch repair protein MutS
MSGGNQKVLELYLSVLAQKQKLFENVGKSRIALLMQVGDFYEAYGIEYPDGRQVGTIWDLTDNLGLKLGNKEQSVYNDKSIKCYMAGVPQAQLNKFIQIAVDRYNWTVVIYSQRLKNPSVSLTEFERYESMTVSPGINMISETSVSNITMCILIEWVADYLSATRQTGITGGNINIGIAYIDTLTGDNGVNQICNSAMNNIAIPFDEILKILTIKNPRELIIHLKGINKEMLSDTDIINAFHLFNYNHKIMRDVVEDKLETYKYQEKMLESIYIKQRGIMSIMQQIGLDDPDYIYSRTALCALLEYVIMHDRSVTDKLNKPEISFNSDKYLMLANNCLEQLDIIDNMRSNTNDGLEYGAGRRLSLLDLINKTKTSMGMVKLRERLSAPITDCEILNKRYSTVSELLNFQRICRAKNTKDVYGTPIYIIRGILSSIRNIENYIRRIVTKRIIPCEIDNLINSLSKSIELIDYIKSIGNKIPILVSECPSNETYENIASIIKIAKNSLIFENCAKIWSDIDNNIFKPGVFKDLDILQEKIDADRHFLDILISELTKIAAPNFIIEVTQSDAGISTNKNTPKSKGGKTKSKKSGSDSTSPKVGPSIGVYDSDEDDANADTSSDRTSSGKSKETIIYKQENSQKGIHLVTKPAYKDAIDRYFKSGKTIIIGSVKISSDNISFSKLKETRWQIVIPEIKSVSEILKASITSLVNSIKVHFVEWCDSLFTHHNIVMINELSKYIADVDVTQSNVLTTIENGYVRPIIDNGDSNMDSDSGDKKSYLIAKQIRHPIIEHINTSTKYIANDVSMGIDGQTGILLFGVNAVGKSSLMKSIGINIIMAQAGMFVAAQEFTYKPYKYLFTRIKSNDNLYAGLSSFEVEMKEFKIILQYANSESIILGDELCSGTETQDATALVASGIIQLSKRSASFIFATHLHFLAEMQIIKSLENVKLYHLRVERDTKDPNKLVYSRILAPGNGPKSYGILVCETMNLDAEFIRLAKEIRLSIRVPGTSSGGDNKSDIGAPYIGYDINQSKYNKEKLVGSCEICLYTNAVDVHHIGQQCTADSSGIINGEYHKNNKWNLVALCKECHQGIHASPPKIAVSGYVQSTNGIELKWNYVDHTESSAVRTTSPQPPRYEEIVNVSSKLPADIVRQMFAENPTFSPQKIQTHLRNKYSISVSQNDIRKLINVI